MKRILTIAISILTVASTIEAAPQKKSARAGSGGKSQKRAAIKSATPQPQQPVRQPEVSQGVTDAIATQRLKFSCTEHYNLCMDNICGNEFGTRYFCSDTLDDYEFVERNGAQVRIGPDLYMLAKATCAAPLKSCDLAERSRIENGYKQLVQKDILTKNYVEAMRYSGEEAKEEAKEIYKACMANICGQGWADCLTLSAIERRAEACEPALAGTAQKASVRRSFYEEMQKQLADLCKNSGGLVAYDTKKCEVQVAYGKTEIAYANGKPYYTKRMTKELDKKKFRIGEMVECTQAYFGIDYRENLDEEGTLIQTIKGMGKVMAGAGMIVGGAILSIFGGAGTPILGAGISVAGAGVADTIEGAIMADSGVRGGQYGASFPDEGCHVKDSLFAPMGTFFKIGFSME